MKKKHITHKTGMKPMVTILSELNTEGYKTQFKATAIGLLSLTSLNMFKPNEIIVKHFYRYEGESDVSDSSIIYAIETKDGENGTLIVGYDIASDALVSEYMANVVNIHK